MAWGRPTAPSERAELQRVKARLGSGPWHSVYLNNLKQLGSLCDVNESFRLCPKKTVRMHIHIFGSSLGLLHRLSVKKFGLIVYVLSWVVMFPPTI